MHTHRQHMVNDSRKRLWTTSPFSQATMHLSCFACSRIEQSRWKLVRPGHSGTLRAVTRGRRTAGRDLAGAAGVALGVAEQRGKQLLLDSRPEAIPVVIAVRVHWDIAQTLWRHFDPRICRNNAFRGLEESVSAID